MPTSARPLRYAALLLLLLAQLLPRPAQAQATRGWEPLVKVSQNDNTRSFEPAIALDPQGFTHVVYSGGPRPEGWLILYSNNRGGSFFKPRVISRSRGEHRDVDIAAGPEGRIHVVYTMKDQGQVFYVESPNLGANWIAPYLVSRSREGRAFEPAIAVDAIGNLHIVWLDSRGGVFQTFYITRQAGKWGPNVVIGRATNDDAPDVAAEGAGATARVHIVFAGRPRGSKSNADFEIYYVAGSPGQLGQPLRLTNDDEPDYTPVIASDGAGGLFLAYNSLERAGHTVMFRRSLTLGASWTPRAAVSPPNATLPAIALGRNYNQPAVTIAFQVGQYTRARVLSLDFYPLENRFGATTDLLSTTRGESGRVALGGRPELNRSVATYQGKDNLDTYKIYARGRSRLLGGAIRLNDDAPLANSSRLALAWLGVQGQPAAMRIAVDRPPTPSDPPVPFAPLVAVDLPPRPGICLRSVQAQLISDDGTLAGVVADTILVDTAAQARFRLRNPGFGATDYVRTPQVHATLFPLAECTALTGSEPALPRSGLGFSGMLPLPPGPDGPRTLTILALDAAGNRTPYTATITLDTTPPVITAGALDLPDGPLDSVLLDLRIAGIAARDNLFPGGVYALQIANLVPGAAPRWTTVSFTRAPDGALLVPGWSVASGLRLSAAELAATPIELRVRALDAVGNPSAQTISATLRLAPGFAPATQSLPLLLGGR